MLAYDMTVHCQGHGYEELCRDRERRAVGGTQGAEEKEEMSSAKEQYLKNKKETAEARKNAKRRERLEAEAEKIEKEIEGIDSEMATEAATDYVRLAELDTKKNELEERLLEIYEELG
jgi:predicted DsbA family dithiol-disulfide isomerase